MKKNFFLIVAALLLSSMAFAATQKVTIDVTADSLAGKYSWASGSIHQVVQLDGNITLSVDTNVIKKNGESGYYYTGDWRMYQARVDSFWLTANNGALIDSVQLTYTVTNTGTWSTKRGSSLEAKYCLASNAILATGGQSKVCLYVGNTSTKTNGQLRISRFRVYYRGLLPKKDPTVKFANANVYKRITADPFTNTLTNTSDGAVTYKSDNEQVATVDNNGLVTFVGVGDAKITANVAASDDYNAASASYQLSVRPENWNIETFKGAGTASTSYYTTPASSVNASTDTDLKWTVLFGYIGANSGNMGGFGPVVRQRKSTESASDPGYLLSDSIEGGIDSLSFQWNSNGNESGNWNTIVYINNDSVGEIKDAATGIKPVGQVPTFTVGNLKKTGKFVIRIVNNTPAGGNSNAKRFVVGNVQWYGYAIAPEPKKAEMSFAKDEVRTVLSGSVANALSKKTDATPQYASSNTAVAEVDASTGAITIKNVGQTKITATCAATADYKAGEASYELIVRAGGNTLKETFGKVDNAGSAAGLNVLDWNGDLFTWQATGNARRKPNSDTIYNTTTQGTFIGMNPDSVGGTGILRSKEAVEGGIKYISFFWKQWATENDGRTLRLNIYAGEDSVTCVEHVALNPNPKNVYWYYAASNVMKANKQLIIKNASRLVNGELTPKNSRVILDTIEITPYLLYSKKLDTLDISETTTYKNESLIDNRDNDNAIAYSVLEGDATVNANGVVTPNTTGTMKVQAKWGEVTTTYTLVVKNSSQYLLTWNADGGTVSGGTEAGYITVGTALEAPTATKTGYNHTGWNPAVPEVMPAENFTSTAQYEAKQCNITLKSNYEGGEDDIEFVATYGETSPVGGETAKFTRPGYSIVRGFWKDSVKEVSGERLVNSNGNFTTNVKNYTNDKQEWVRDAEEDITLYAHWKLDTFKITYANMEGATNFEDAPVEYTVETPTITLGTPTKTGYTFNGWKKTNAEGEAVTEIAKGSTGKITLWATWTANKTIVHFIANGGDATATFDTVVEYGTRVAILQAAEVTSKLTRENYKFNNYWTEEEGGLRMTNVVTSGKLYFLDGTREGYLKDGKWIKEGGEATFYAHWTLSTLVLNEGADNSAMLSEADGKTVDVTINRSKLVPEVWNSLCLPFAIAKSDLGTAQVVEMTGAEMDNDVINVTFAEFNSDSLVAGTPYLVKPTAEVELTSFTSKTIDATPKTIGDNGMIELTGIYSPMALTANDKSKLFLAQPDAKGNNLFFASKDGSLKGMRAYFNLLSQSGAPVRMGRMVIATPTGMVDVNANVNENQKMIIDGQLVIVRNGVYYNVNGQIVK